MIQDAREDGFIWRQAHRDGGDIAAGLRQDGCDSDGFHQRRLAARVHSVEEPAICTECYIMLHIFQARLLGLDEWMAESLDV